MSLSEGDSAPAFSAPDQTGSLRKLSEFQGEWLVLYFYPKDFTSGCTKEACEFRDHYNALKQKAEVVGVSTDSQESHARFSAKHDLPFPLLSDPGKKIISAYGANAGIFTKRFTYLIDPQGNIKKIYKKVDPQKHARQILSDIEGLQEE